VSPSPDLDDLVARLRAAGCVFAEDEARLLREAAAEGRDLDELADRRITGEPLEHLLGRVEFFGLRLVVEPGVFVPRSRTALLVHQALTALTASGTDNLAVVDLCCGCGAVGAAVLAARPDVDLHAADVDPVAVRCARRNLPPDRVHQGDLYAALPADLRGRVDVLVANAPYVPTDDIAMMPPEARDHEPRTALDGGGDGLDVLRRVVAGAPDWLRSGGTVLVECSVRQAPVLTAAMAGAGLEADVVHDDETGGTVVRGLSRRRS
jgi:release factor glutamine methyltransferase